MLLTVDLPHARDLLVHEVFPGDVITVGKVINLLILLQRLIDVGFQGRAAPHDSPILAFQLGDLSEPVIFQSKPDDLYITLMKFEIISAVWRLEGPQRYWVLVGPEN